MNWTDYPRRLLVLVAGLFGIGCGFRDSIDHGVPNFGPAFEGNARLFRMGQPANDDAWGYVKSLFSDSVRVLVVKLNDDVEGSDEIVKTWPNWQLLRVPLAPEDDKPWSIMLAPKPDDVRFIVSSIIRAQSRGYIVLWHCSHGRDRTSLIAALVGRALYDWSRERMEADMTAHGFRWVLPDLTGYFFLGPLP